MQDQDRFFDAIYAIDQATDAYMIEACLDDYGDLFNEWTRLPLSVEKLIPTFSFIWRVVPMKFLTATR